MQRSEEVNLLNFEHEEEAISVSEGCLMLFTLAV